jgi:cation diffusion facilitator family transporter
MQKPERSPIYYAYQEGWVSLSINILLFVIKYWIGVLAGSIAIIADAWHTLSDSISSVIIILGFKVTEKPADRDHPFGHGRAQLIVSLIVGVILAVIAFNFILESIDRLQTRTRADIGLIAYLVIGFSVIAKEAMYRYAIRIGRNFNLNAIIADAWHHRSDAISSLVILVGLFANRYFWWVDGVLGLLVALFIIQATYEIMRDAINPLLGETPDEKLVSNIKGICREYLNAEVYAHHFHVHKYGDHTELTFHVKMPGSLSLNDAHDLVTKVEQGILERFKIHSTIHMEPF